MTIKLPKNLANKDLLKYMLMRIIIHTKQMIKELNENEIDYTYLYADAWSLQGYLNLARRIIRAILNGQKENKGMVNTQ